MSELDDAILGRRSIRRFRAEVPSKELLLEILQLATWAPSAMNRQDWQFTVVTFPTTRGKMVELVRSEWERVGQASQLLGESLRSYEGNFVSFSEAPLLIAVSARRPPSFLIEAFGTAAERVCGSATSAAMAMQNLLLTAHARGLGACVFTGPVAAEKALCKLLGLAGSHSLIGLVALGYPAEAPLPKPRRPIQEVFHFLDS